MMEWARLMGLRTLVAVVALGSAGFAQESGTGNCLTRSGEHKGLFVRAEFGLLGTTQVERKFPAIGPTDYTAVSRLELGIGYALRPGLIGHLQLGWSDPVPAHELPHPMLAIGPAITWYTPFANTFLTSHLSYSTFNVQGGSEGSLWSLGIGKELLFADHFGIGLLGAYRSGQWSDNRSPLSSWRLGGVELHLTLTYN